MKQKKGITLIEVLIGLVVSTAIFLVATNLITSLFGSSTRQKQLEILEQTKNDLQTDIGNNIKWAEESVSFVDGELKADGSEYVLVDGVLYKNSTPLTPDDVYVESFNVTKYSSSIIPTEFSKGIGLTGRYFNTESFSEYVFDRIDPTIDFDWDGDSPDERMGADTFSVRWTGQIETPHDGEYRFHVQSSDGTRLYIDDQLVIDDWKDGSTSAIGRIDLLGGRRYNFAVEYYEKVGRANISVQWSHRDFGIENIPITRLYPTALLSTIEVVIDLHYENAPDVKDTISIIVSPRSGGIIGSIQTNMTPTPTLTGIPTATITGTIVPTASVTPTVTPGRGGNTPTPQPTITGPTNSPTPTPKPLR